MKPAAALLILALLAPFGAAAQTADDCQTQGMIVQRLADFRKDGIPRARAERMLVRSLADHAKRFEPAVTYMADFVYNQVPEAQLAPDLGAVFQAQCVAALPQIQN